MDYKIEGESLPILTLSLNRGESLISEAGAKSWMTGNIDTQTEGDSFTGMLKRLATRETLFKSKYTALEDNCSITFSSSFPGSIIPYRLNGNKIIAQKDAYLCRTDGVTMDLVTTNLKNGFFAGEGLFLQSFSGDGLVFLEIDGFCYEYDLKPGEKINVDTGLVAAYESTVNMDIKNVGSVKNAVFGGEGIFNTILTGPGKIYLQSMSARNLAKVIRPYLPTNTSS